MNKKSRRIKLLEKQVNRMLELLQEQRLMIRTIVLANPSGKEYQDLRARLAFDFLLESSAATGTPGTPIPMEGIGKQIIPRCRAEKWKGECLWSDCPQKIGELCPLSPENE